ncbi:uncharacterized protein [Maniola hyperantus]|uniref:uncharacterized protein n=1 Tax=Aphantopus hyperantus TaxID=2795564 RepID=UPI00374A5CE5
MAPVFTRKAAAMEEQQKLKNALQELKSLKQLNAQLLKEQDESEAEMRAVIARNSQLKAELANLHSAHTLLSEERDQLQVAVGSFDQCIQTYEEALGKISMLEDELSQSQKLICDLQSQIASYETQKTNNLYDELLASSSTAPVVTIDLTCDSPCAGDNKPHLETIFLNSHKKIKKYIKIGKFIKRTKKLIKNQKVSSKNIMLRKERSDLLNKLNAYCSSFQKMREQYETDVQSLNKEISKLENSLRTVTSQYELSRKQVGEQILAADELLALSNYNIDRFDSLVNKCECSNNVPSDMPVLSQCTEERKGCENNDILLCSPQRKTFVVSDGLGKDFGHLLSNKLHQKVFNVCNPGAPYEYIIENVKGCCLDKHSTVVLLIGDSMQITKKEILRSFAYLLDLQNRTGCKFIFCTFPYSCTLTPAQNRYIYNLNRLLHNLTYGHRDYFHIIDTNNFIKKFSLTKDTMYLPHRCKKQIATLVAYNIQDPAIFSLNYAENGTCCTKYSLDITICVYRPPSGDFVLFEDVMEEALRRIYVTKDVEPSTVSSVEDSSVKVLSLATQPLEDVFSSHVEPLSDRVTDLEQMDEAD